MINRKDGVNLILILIFCLAPEALQIITQSDSTSWAFSATSVFIFFYMVRLNSTRQLLLKMLINPYVLFIVVTIFVHGIVAGIIASNLGRQFDITRFALSYILLFFLLVNSSYIISFIYSRNFEGVIYGANVTFAIAGIMGILGYTFLGAYEDRKPIMLFSEISHYASFIAPFYCFLMVYRGYRLMPKIIMSLIYVTTTLKYQSATLLFVIVTVLIISQARFRIVSLALASVAIFAMIIFWDIDISYYTSRMSIEISDESTNMSLLSGLEQALISLQDTYGTGYGFQQMGVNPPKGMAAVVGYLTAGDYVNRFDGSVAVAKMIVEFGLIGVMFMIAYVGILINSIYILSKYIRKTINIGAEIVFAHCCVFSFGVYYFVRGGGYFVPAFSFAIAAIAILYGKNVRPFISSRVGGHR